MSYAPVVCSARRLFLAWLLAFAATSTVSAQQVGTATLTGRVTAETGEPVGDAAVTLLRADETVATARTGTDGRYRIASIPAGRYGVRVSRIGFRSPAARSVQFAAGGEQRLSFALQTTAVEIEGILAEGRANTDRERTRFETDAGVTARVVGGEQIKMLPGLAEADVLRAIEVLPGVVSTSDFSSSFNVRGGAADQNLILLDGFPIYNPFHLGGLFSVFNADAVARAELFAGGFGAEYGGRVSSVLSVESRTDVPERVEVDAGVSVLASRLLVAAPMPGAVAGLLGGDEGSWRISARRSYFDALLEPLVDFPYHLTDLQAHASLATRGGGSVSLTGYWGEDVLDLSDFTPPGDDDASDILRIRWNWGNSVVGARWRQPIGAWVADTRLGVTRFGEDLGFLDFDDVTFSSGVRQSTLRSDWGRDLGARTGIKIGGAVERLSAENLAEAGGTTFFETRSAGTLASGYGSVLWRPTDRWLVEPGLRVDSWLNDGESFTTLAPRFAVKRFWGAERDGAVKLAVGRYTQFVQSLRNEEFPVSNDNWVLAGAGIPVVVSDQAQLGVEKFWGDQWYASAEAYWRSFDGLTDFNFVDDPNDPTDEFASGDGRSYGLDLLVRREQGRLNGFVAVSLLRAEQTLPDPQTAGFDDLPPTVTFPPIYDRRVDIDLVLQYRLPWNVEFGTRWNFGSGLPYTRPIAQYFDWEYDPATGVYRPAGADFGADHEHVPLEVLVGERNAQRYPAYHRLDLTARRRFERRWGSFTPYLQLLNAYNQRNVLFYFYNYDKLPPTRSGLSMFPALPALGIEVSF